MRSPYLSAYHPHGTPSITDSGGKDRSSRLESLAAAALGALAGREGEGLEERQGAVAAGREGGGGFAELVLRARGAAGGGGGEDFAERVLGWVALAEAEEAVGKQEAGLEEGRIEVEGGAVAGGGLLGAAGEVVEEAVESVDRRDGGGGGQGRA